MTNKEFLKHAEKYYDTASFEHAKKLVEVAETAKEYDKKSGHGHTDICDQPMECTCGYWRFYVAIKELERE